MKNKITTQVLREKKQRGEKIAMLTAYDYSMARILDEAEVDVLLVGDSLGMVMLGYDSTIPVTMADMLHHVKAVTRGTKRALVVADMPFMSYHLDKKETMQNAAQLMQEGGAHAVKLEGGREVAETVNSLVTAGVPVMGHIGLTPQQVNQLGGFIVQGKDEKTANKIIDDALALQDAGAFSIVLECVPVALAQAVTEKVKIPTIGIGAGVNCDGQVLVIQDMLGLYDKFVPKFVKQYAQLNIPVKQAVQQYIQEVRDGVFPEEKHSFVTQEKFGKLY